tara:strand:- start:34301 stop:34897 length:597 start_codon:yes stop_codon:yes gene_type:complete
MFGIDTFNYGQTFHAPITDYTDPDDEKYYCITHPDLEEGYDASELFLTGGRILYINGDNNITNTDGSLMNQRLDSISDREYLPASWANASLILELEGLGFVKDCEKALQPQNQSSNNQNNNTNNNNNNANDNLCEDTNQETNEDGSCGDCLDGYVVDDNENSDSYGSCVEESDDENMNDMILYGAIGLGALLLISSII